MDPNWNDAVPSWRKRKTPRGASSGRAATASIGQVRQWATVPRHADDTTPRTGSAMRRSLSTPGLATVGLGRFNIGALHEVIQQPDTNHDKEQCDDFFPGGLGVPDSFQGEGPIRIVYATNEPRFRVAASTRVTLADTVVMNNARELLLLILHNGIMSSVLYVQ